MNYFFIRTARKHYDTAQLETVRLSNLSELLLTSEPTGTAGNVNGGARENYITGESMFQLSDRNPRKRGLQFPLKQKKTKKSKCYDENYSFCGLRYAGHMSVSLLRQRRHNRECDPQQPEAQTAVKPMKLVAKISNGANATRSVNSSGVTSWAVGEKVAVYYPTTDYGHNSVEAEIKSVTAEGDGIIEVEFPVTQNGEGKKVGPAVGTVKLVYPSARHNGSGGYST